jgi:uncharacterized protein (TIGR02271 family)
MQVTSDNAARLRGCQMRGRDGEKIGEIVAIYQDDRTGQPEWALVRTGLFGTRSSFVPLREADTTGEDEVTVPYAKSTVKDAPNVDEDQHLAPDEERALYKHYSVDWGDDDAGRARTKQGRGAVGRDTSGRTTDEAMTRSEEELDVTKTQREAGRVRLRKYVETETETRTVPVKKEKIAVEREPITKANKGQALKGPEISDEEHEVVLHEEEVDVSKRAVPKERVRLDKDVEMEEREVSEDVRKERIELDDDSTRR